MYGVYVGLPNEPYEPDTPEIRFKEKWIKELTEFINKEVENVNNSQK